MPIHPINAHGNLADCDTKRIITALAPIPCMPTKHADNRPAVIAWHWRAKTKQASLKQPMPLEFVFTRVKIEHRSAEHYRIMQRGTRHILNYIWQASSDKPFTSWPD
jgi:hypothetical protein